MMNDKISVPSNKNPSIKSDSDKLLFIAFLLVVSMLVFWFLEYRFRLLHAEIYIVFLFLIKMMCGLATIALGIYFLFKHSVKVNFRTF